MLQKAFIRELRRVKLFPQQTPVTGVYRSYLPLQDVREVRFGFIVK